jgi:predicted nucleic acid-binding protein
MILLDTNVVSEAMKQEPHPSVKAWLNSQPSGTLYLSSVTIAELLFGLAILPAGRRKDALSRTFDGLLTLFRGRVLDFDAQSAAAYARCAAAARAAGRGFPIPDGFIAAIAATHGLTVATRDTAPFIAGGLAVTDPWQA